MVVIVRKMQYYFIFAYRLAEKRGKFGRKIWQICQHSLKIQL